jgi:outer membrane protein OmpA-like peptidoglycan-associated protein
MGKSNEKKRDFFWLSYSDLMTSLFFVMLVLFILVFSMQNKLIDDLKDSNDTLTAAKEELERIKEIEKTVNNIDRNYFRYNSINKKHILNMSFLYPTGSSDITKIFPDKRPDLINAGKAIKDLILKYPEEENIKYLVVVEGQASNDGWRGNDDLSYHRAQSLVNLWKQNNVGLEKLKNCEIVIVGSGVKGVPREIPDIPPANQRFLITIVPKIGEMKK